MRLLECFDYDRPEMALPEFVARVGYSKTTTYRLLRTLVHAGWLERTATGGFRPTFKSFRLGTILVDNLVLRREAGLALTELAARHQDTVHLVVPEDGQTVCVERIDGASVSIMDLDVGKTMAYNLGAGPRALLAYREEDLLPGVLEAGLEGRTDKSIVDPDDLRADLAKTRERGYSLSQGDVTEGVAAVGAPVFDRSGVAVAAISISGLRDRYEPPRDGEVARDLIETCTRLSVRLGWDPSRMPPVPA